MAADGVFIESAGGHRLAGVLHRSESWPAGGPAAIVCHGMLSSKDSPKHLRLASELASRGVMALRFDFAGRGESTGDMHSLTVSRQVQDLAAAVARVRGLGAGQVSIVGSSLGGAVAVLFAGKYGGIASLVTLACVSRPAAIFHDLLTREQRAAWKRTGTHRFDEGSLGYGFYEDALDQDVLAAASRVDCPALFIHGSLDEMVPPSSSRDLHSVAMGRKRLVILEGADHRFSDPAHLVRILGLVVGWIAL